jgi:hypothetical protein
MHFFFIKFLVHADNIHRWKDSSERLYNEIIGLFSRSRLQEQNKPKTKAAVQNRVDDEVGFLLYSIIIWFTFKECCIIL